MADEIEKLEQQLKYEEAMYQSCLEYPTDTAQFYKALEDNRIRIDKMRNKIESLKCATPQKGDVK